jgi:hypothetical protein
MMVFGLDGGGAPAAALKLATNSVQFCEAIETVQVAEIAAAVPCVRDSTSMSAPVVVAVSTSSVKLVPAAMVGLPPELLPNAPTIRQPLAVGVIEGETTPSVPVAVTS